MRIFSFGLLLCLTGALAAPAGAAVSYSYSYVTDSTGYSGPAGSIVQVNIFLKETLSGTTSSYITSNNGLSAAGAAVNATGTAGGTAASFGTGSALYTSASSFGNASSTAGNTLYYNQGTGGNNLEFEQTISSSQSGVDPNAGGLVLLGTLDVTVGSGTTTYALTSLDKDTINNSNSQLGQQDGNTITELPPPFGTDLDKSGATPTGASGTAGTINGGDAAAPTYTFTVAGAAPVPEPVSVAVFGIGAVGLLLRRRSRLA